MGVEDEQIDAGANLCFQAPQYLELQSFDRHVGRYLPDKPACI